MSEKKESKNPPAKKPRQNKVVINALKRATSGSSMKVHVGYDDTFRVAIVYAYGTFDDYKTLRKALYEEKGHGERPAKGLCSFGQAVKEIGHALSFVWVSNEEPLKDTLPTFVHEIVHMSQDIIKHVQVEDESGEVQAYMIERELAVVMKEMLGMDVPDCDVAEKVRKVIDQIGPDKPVSDNQDVKGETHEQVRKTVP